jgi:hypothetical protein
MFLHNWSGAAGGPVPPTGQNPSAGDQVPPTPTTPPSTPPPTDPTTPPPSGTGAGDDEEKLTPEQLRDALRKERQRQAADRVDRNRLKELEAAEAKRKESEMTDAQKAQARADAAEKALQAANDKVLRAEIKAMARDYGIRPEVAARMISVGDVELDANGDPKNLAKLFKELVAEMPELAGKTNAPGGQVPNTPNPGATNPQRQDGVIQVTVNQALDPTFQEQFRQAHGMSITDATFKGKATIV